MKREMISYLFFGVCTTAVNYIAYFVMKRSVSYQIANAIAWLVAVLFAYITNKIWVFESKSTDLKHVFQEFVNFISGRIFSGVFEMGFLIVAVEWLSMNDGLAKIIGGVVVVILNYIISKLFVFKNKHAK